ncbi:hypothetical protein Bca4012_083663 [Brassica carinata]
MQAVLKLLVLCRSLYGLRAVIRRLWRSGETKERTVGERSAFRVGMDARSSFPFFRYPVLPSTTAVHDSVGDLFHLRSTLGCGGVTNGGVVRRLVIKVSFSGSRLRRVAWSLILGVVNRRCAPCFSTWWGSTSQRRWYVLRWYELHAFGNFSLLSGHAVVVKVRLSAVQSSFGFG